MKQAGRVHWLVLIGIAGVILLAAIFALSTGSPSNAAAEFMLALAKGDSDKLTDLTSLGNRSRDEIKKEWDFAVNVAGKYYRFRYTLKDEHIQGDKQAAIRLDVERNFGSPGSYAEPFELPMVKEDGKWKVNVRGISRQMYPDLPR